MQTRTWLLAVFALVAGAGARSPVAAHDGPPFPIVSNHTAGSYEIDVWTDPDATDDGSAAGQFWVIVKPAGASGEPPAGTAVTVSIRPAAGGAAWATERAEPVDGRVSRQFAVLVMDHEGRFDVRVEVAGPLGPAVATAWVDATYDLRPPPVMLALYLMPFVVVGVLWMTRLIRRRRARG